MGDNVTPGGVPSNSRLQNGAYQAPMNADGSITVPAVLRPYMGGLEKLSA